MQNKHQNFFLSCWCPNVRGGGGAKPVGTKSQVYPKKLLDGSPYQTMQTRFQGPFLIPTKPLLSVISFLTAHSEKHLENTQSEHTDISGYLANIQRAPHFNVPTCAIAILF